MTSKYNFIALMVAASVASAPALAQQNADEQQSVKRSVTESAGSLVEHDREIKDLEKRLEKMELQTEIIKLSNEIKKATYEGRQIGKEDKDDSQSRQSGNAPGQNEEVTYYRGPSNQQSRGRGNSEDEEDELTPEELKEKNKEEARARLREALENARVVRTFKEAGKEQRQAVIALRKSNVPVETGTTFGQWTVTIIESGMVALENAEDDEQITIGL